MAEKSLEERKVEALEKIATNLERLHLSGQLVQRSIERIAQKR